MGIKRFNFVLGLAAILTFAALAVILRSAENTAIRSAAAFIPPSSAPSTPPKPPDHLRILGLVRSTTLITVELNSLITTRCTDESWRGDAEAVVTAPVRYFYGVDLAALPDGALTFDPIRATYTLKAPPPRRVATEVFADNDDALISLGWGRFRAIAGEKVLATARRQLTAAAREATLSPEDQQRVIDLSRQQLATLVRTFTAEPAQVEIRFETTVDSTLSTAPPSSESP